MSSRNSCLNRNHQSSNTRRQWQSLEFGLSSAAAMQQKVEKEKKEERGQVEEEEEVVIVVMVKEEVGCPGLPSPYSITLCQQLCSLFLEWGIEAIASLRVSFASTLS